MPKCSLSLEQKERARVMRVVFAQNFRIAREQLGLSQRRVFEITRISQSTISSIENAAKPLSMDHAVVLADLVNLPLWVLLRPGGDQRSSKQEKPATRPFPPPRKTVEKTTSAEPATKS